MAYGQNRSMILPARETRGDAVRSNDTRCLSFFSDGGVRIRRCRSLRSELLPLAGLPVIFTQDADLRRVFLRATGFGEIVSLLWPVAGIIDSNFHELGGPVFSNPFCGLRSELFDLVFRVFILNELRRIPGVARD